MDGSGVTGIYLQYGLALAFSFATLPLFFYFLRKKTFSLDESTTPEWLREDSDE